MLKSAVECCKNAGKMLLENDLNNCISDSYVKKCKKCC